MAVYVTEGTASGPGFAIVWRQGSMPGADPVDVLRAVAERLRLLPDTGDMLGSDLDDVVSQLKQTHADDLVWTHTAEAAS